MLLRLAGRDWTGTWAWRSGVMVICSIGGCVSQPIDARGAGSREIPNYAFATQLGSGVYAVNGRTVQIYRFSPGINIRSLEGRSWGLRLRLPLTLGFYDFQVTDVITEGLPDRVSVAALVPTLEIPVRLAGTWYLVPFGGVGVGRDNAERVLSIVYATGAQALAIWPWHHLDFRLGSRLLYSAYMDEERQLVDDYGVLEIGIDVQRGLGLSLAGHEIAGSVFGVNYLYLVSPQVIQQFEQSIEMEASWEFGFTLGTLHPWKVLGLRLPRLGLSYRFGDDRDAYRLIVGNPFPLDPPERLE